MPAVLIVPGAKAQNLERMAPVCTTFHRGLSDAYPPAPIGFALLFVHGNWPITSPDLALGNWEHHPDWGDTAAGLGRAGSPQHVTAGVGRRVLATSARQPNRTAALGTWPE